MNEKNKNILNEVQSRIDLISEDEFRWIISILGTDGYDAQGNTFLHLAAARGFQNACREILLSSQGPDCKNNAGKTPAALALEHGHLDLALFINSYDMMGLQSNTEARLQKTEIRNRGTFDPTHSTRLMDADTEWSLPEDLQESAIESVVNAAPEASDGIEALATVLAQKLKAARITPLHSSLALYLRCSELIRNIFACNRSGGEEDFISWVADTLEESDALSEIANIIATQIYEFKPKTQSILDSLMGDIQDLISLLGWIKRTSESQSICDRASKIKESVEARMSDLRELTSEALGFSDSITSVDIERMMGQKIKNDLVCVAQQWIDEYGRQTEIIDQLCRILEGDLFERESPSDIEIFNPARKVILSMDLFERFKKNDSFMGLDDMHEPQWNTKLWSFHRKQAL